MVPDKPKILFRKFFFETSNIYFFLVLFWKKSRYCAVLCKPCVRYSNDIPIIILKEVFLVKTFNLYSLLPIFHSGSVLSRFSVIILILSSCILQGFLFFRLTKLMFLEGEYVKNRKWIYFHSTIIHFLIFKFFFLHLNQYASCSSAAVRNILASWKFCWVS